MAIRIRIPGLLRLVLVREASVVAAFTAAAGIDRPLSGRGPLVNRLISHKLALFRTPLGQVWPAFAARQDAVRAANQVALEHHLDKPETLGRIGVELDAVAAWVRRQTDEPVGVLLQRAVGRLFFVDYIADRQSYEAAVTLSNWISAGPIRSFYLRRSGQVAAALTLITMRAHGDVACAHATALTLPNLMQSIELMRSLADQRSPLRPADAAQQVLRAPPRVIREVRDLTTIGECRIGARSLVLLAVEHARRQAGSSSSAFFTGAWNQCPAHRLVPVLLCQVWQRVVAHKP